MAFNLNTIKALFGKLAPMADDVAGAVANYGDDAARLIANNADDAARLAANQGDDLYGFFKNFEDYGPDDPLPFEINNSGQLVAPFPGGAVIDGKPFHYPTRYTPQNALKERLLDKRLGVAMRPEPANVANISNYADPDFGFPKDTNVLGDAVLKHAWAPNRYDSDILDYTGSTIQPYDVFNQTLPQPISTSGMVIQTPEVLNGIEHSDDGAFGIRPHRNTALGKWFAKNNPNYGWDFEEPFYF